MRGGGREEKERRRGIQSTRAPLMRPKVEQTAARTRYFKASFTDEIDLIEGIARNENRMRSASRASSRFYACLRARLSCSPKRERRPSSTLIPIETPPPARPDPPPWTFTDRLDLCDSPKVICFMFV